MAIDVNIANAAVAEYDAAATDKTAVEVSANDAQALLTAAITRIDQSQKMLGAALAPANMVDGEELYMWYNDRVFKLIKDGASVSAVERV